MESKTSVSEDIEIKSSTRQNTASGFAANMNRANNSYTHQLKKKLPIVLIALVCTTTTHQHMITNTHGQGCRSVINSNGIDVVINMLISPSLCFCVCSGKQAVSTRKERCKQLFHPVIRWHKQQCRRASTNTHTYKSPIHYASRTQKDPTSNGSIRKQQSPPLHTYTHTHNLQYVSEMRLCHCLV